MAQISLKQNQSFGQVLKILEIQDLSSNNSQASQTLSEYIYYICFLLLRIIFFATLLLPLCLVRANKS